MSDEAVIGKILDQMYAMISGPAGPRDWTRRAELFHPDSRQVRTWLEDGRPAMKMMGGADYVADTEPFFRQNSFYEIEVARRIQVFGNIAHAWSVYEARPDPEAGALDRRGINSIQLVKDESGTWRILHMVWDNERPGMTASV